jgi:ABC-type polysaccharide/polyol phosphate transport system ATPase subunit
VTDAIAIADDELLVLDGVSKRVTGIHEVRYTPTVSLAARFRARSEGASLAGAGGDVGDDDDADMDDDDFDDDEEENVPERRQSDPGASDEWAVRDVSFALQAGEALGIVGDRDTVDVLMQVIGRMTDPTEGRMLYRGRLGFSFGLAAALVREENASAPRVLKLLSRLGGVPRPQREPWVADGLRLIGGDVPPPSWRFVQKDLRKRLALAASLDPTADVLVIDKFADYGDAAFWERCLQRLGDGLARGASIVLACPDLDVIARLSSRVAWLDRGRITTIGPAADVLDRFRSSLRDEERAAYAATPSFNAVVAIHDVKLVGAHEEDGVVLVRTSQRFEVQADLETARAETFVSCRVRLVGPSVASISADEPSRLSYPGGYVARLQVDARRLEEGEYALSLEVIAYERRGQRSVAVRACQLPLRVVADGDPEANVRRSDFAEDLPMLDWSIVSELELERA